jgi:superfamily II DNA/RNA helicase
MCRGHTEWTSSGEGNDLEEFIFESQDFIRNSSLSLSSDLYEELFMKNDEHGLDPVFRQSIIFSSMENRHSRNLYLQLEKRGYSSFAVGTGTNVA